MRKPLTREDLDQAQFAEMGTVAGALGLTASCHTAGLQAWYFEGALVLRCAACERIITVVAVAADDAPRIVS